jgi:hypothetical protein
MDPAPFDHRDLDPNVEEFLESSALEHPPDSHFRIVVHVEQMPTDDPTELVAEAIHNYFEYKASRSRRNLHTLLVEGRRSLLIGTGFLTLCLFIADKLSAHSGIPFLRILKESLTIGGWVAMWRPMQILLYDWWPLVRHQGIYRRLSLATVQVSQAKLQLPVRKRRRTEAAGPGAEAAAASPGRQ